VGLTFRPEGKLYRPRAIRVRASHVQAVATEMLVASTSGGLAAKPRYARDWQQTSV